MLLRKYVRVSADLVMNDATNIEWTLQKGIYRRRPF